MGWSTKRQGGALRDWGGGRGKSTERWDGALRDWGGVGEHLEMGWSTERWSGAPRVRVEH